MEQDTRYIGLDTDKRQIDIAVAEAGSQGEVRYWGKVANTPHDLARALRKLSAGGRRLEVCYEAGPCGYGIQRRLSAMRGVSCTVVAPSLVPRRPGDRVKTNRRDAEKLARLLRAGELAAVWVPDAAHEALRDLVRARGAAMADLQRCRQRIGGFLLRQEHGYQGKPWTKKHRAWLGALRFEHPAHRAMFAEMLLALDEALARRERLEAHIAELAPGSSLNWLIEALQALRGYRLINAVILVTEIGDPRRFQSPRQLMSYLGMVPSEHSTGERQWRGGLTKAGNARARKTLIEAAWCYARRHSGARKNAAPPLQAIAEKARDRLSRRYRLLTRRGKLPQVAIAAVARESLGFIWAIAHAAAPQTSAD